MHAHTHRHGEREREKEREKDKVATADEGLTGVCCSILSTFMHFKTPQNKKLGWVHGRRGT